MYLPCGSHGPELHSGHSCFGPWMVPPVVGGVCAWGYVVRGYSSRTGSHRRLPWSSRSYGHAMGTPPRPPASPNPRARHPAEGVRHAHPRGFLPYLKSAQAAHPAYRRRLEQLREMGVLIASYAPHRPKAGGGADRFRRPTAVLAIRGFLRRPSWAGSARPSRCRRRRRRRAPTAGPWCWPGTCRAGRGPGSGTPRPAP